MPQLILYGMGNTRKQVSDEVGLHWPFAQVKAKKLNLSIVDDNSAVLNDILEHIIDIGIFDPHTSEYVIEN